MLVANLGPRRTGQFVPGDPKQRHHVTISLGVATLDPDEPLEAARLVVAADSALYRAKASGRNRVEVA